MHISDNPFYILGASLKDSQTIILGLAEEKSLFEDESKCVSASSDIINPKNRLQAELSWVVSDLTFLSINDAYKKLISSKDILNAISLIEGLDNLGKANLLVSVMMDKVISITIDELADCILEMADYYESIDYKYLHREINTLREEARFPLVSNIDTIYEGVQDRGRFFKNTIIEMLDKFPSVDIVKCMTVVSDSATNYGTAHPPRLVSDLIDSYEVEAQSFLDSEMENITSLVEEITEKVSDKGSRYDLMPRIEKLVDVIHNWDAVAQPIQVCCKSRGVRHKSSYEVFSTSRDLAITLFNEYDKLDAAKKISQALKSAFRELDMASERAEEDISALNKIEETRRFDKIINDFQELSKGTFSQIDKNPLMAKSLSERFTIKSKRILDDLLSQGADSKLIDSICDDISFVLLQCAIAYGNKTSRWEDCLSILKVAKNYAIGDKAKNDVSKNLAIVTENARLYHDVEAVSSAPILSSINGIGFTLYGSSDEDPMTGSYVATYYFIFFAIPLFPIARYKVLPINNGYRFLGKVPLRTFDKLHIAAFLGAVLWAFLLN